MLQRQKLGLSKKGLALEAGISDVYVKRIEEGHFIPKNTFIIYKLADALHVNRDWLHDYAYFNRDPEMAVQYLNKDAILEGVSTEGQSYDICLGRNHLTHLTPDLGCKPLLEIFEGLTSPQKVSLRNYLKDNCRGLIFNEKYYPPTDPLYQALRDLADLEEEVLHRLLEEGVLKRILDYLVALSHMAPPR